MAKKIKEKKVKVVEPEIVETEGTTEPEESEKKKKIPFKKIAIGIGAGVAAIGAAGLAIWRKAKNEKELLDYMDSCGNAGTDAISDEGVDPDLNSLVDETTGTDE